MRAGRRRRRPPRGRACGAAGAIERQDVAWRHRPDDLVAVLRGEGPGAGRVPTAVARPAGRRPASPTGSSIVDAQARVAAARRCVHGPEVLALKQTMRDLDLVTVCEEAGCPNLSECWADGTATFMINGERCTRACGFCLVDTRKPLAPAADEPDAVAEAVERMGLAHAVLTTVARDDLADGGMAHVAALRRGHPRRAARARAVEVLISDGKGDADVARRCSSTPAPTC